MLIHNSKNSGMFMRVGELICLFPEGLDLASAWLWVGRIWGRGRRIGLRLLEQSWRKGSRCWTERIGLGGGRGVWSWFLFDKGRRSVHTRPLGFLPSDEPFYFCCLVWLGQLRSDPDLLTHTRSPSLASPLVFFLFMACFPFFLFKKKTFI